MKKIKEIKEKLSKYPLFVYFLISSVLNATLLRVFTIRNYFAFKPLLMDIAIVLFIASLSFLFKEKSRKKYIIVLSIILTAICIINSMYYTYYKSFASVSMLATSVFVVDVSDAVVQNVIQIKDIVFLWQIIGLIYILQKEKKRNIIDKTITAKPKIKKLLFVSLICAVIVCIFTTPQDFAKLSKQRNKKNVVINFGLYFYQANDLVQSLKPQITNILGHDKALKEVREYYKSNNNSEYNNKYTNIFEGKNIIVIHAESLQTMAINKSFNGKAVTPNLNKLASEGIFFDNFYSQVGVGTSSDAEFVFSTSLLPSSTGTVFVNYYDRKFQTIQKSFKEKGYYVASMHANDGDFWNRKIMHENLGYDKFYDKEYYKIDETIGLGLSDKSFFHQSIKYIKQIKEEQKKPFYINMITLSNHTPFSDLEKMDRFDTSMYVDINYQTIRRDYINGTLLGNYFRSVHYSDAAIGDFIKELDETGLLDNTIIVIYGDHDARIDENYYKIYYNYDGYEDRILDEDDDNYKEFNEYTYELNRKVPFIIWSKETKFKTKNSSPMSMIDAYPTLGNMFGIKNKYQLGNDIFNKKDNTVVFLDGSFLTDKIYYNSQKNEIYSINTEVINEDYVQQRSSYADNLIEISNKIIEYDLIKEIEEER